MSAFTPISDDEREDGEIVDDDDFEDISDYSIPSCGKSDSRRALLRPISLSSISDSDNSYTFVDPPPPSSSKHVYVKAASHRRCHRRALRIRKHHRDPSVSVLSGGESSKPRRKKPRTRSSPSTDSSSSSSSVEVDRQTLHQLNKAVRIDAAHVSKHKTLKYRLKSLIRHRSPHENIIVIDDHDAQRSNDDDDDDMDREIAELRIQALKSAILKKHLERKKRKEHHHHHQTVQSSSDKAPEEDEDDLDIMRAMLLASMAKKITDEQPAASTPHPIPNSVVPKSALPPLIAIPPVKPLIIKLGTTSTSDSESEADNAKSASALPKIQNSVEELLRKQRQQFEATLAQIVPVPVAPVQPSVDKSILRLLSKSQQQEYLLLKKKLLQARHEKQGKSVRKEKAERSQTKGKYRELAPLVRHVKGALEERRKCEENIRSLEEQLKEAQRAHVAHQKTYTELLAQLKAARRAIDMRPPLNKSKSTTTVHVPNKVIRRKQTQIDHHPASVVRNDDDDDDQKRAHIIDANVMMNKLKKDECIIFDDVDKINQLFGRETFDMEGDKENARNDALSYVSPLDNRVNVHPHNNPMEMICPYELFGICKDSSCTFNHCS